MIKCPQEGAEETVGSAFGRDSRLRSQWQLNVMRERGIKSAGRRCVLIALESPPDGSRRATFLISRRYSLLAVERNRARRLFREVYRLIYGQLPPLWLLMIPRQRMKGASMWDVMEEVCYLLGRIGLAVSGKARPERHD